MKPALGKTLLWLIVLLTMVYGGDWGCLRYRTWRGTGFGSVSVTPEYVIQEKNGRTEYQFAAPQDQPCVRSLFPHFGYSPCWYVSRHQAKLIEI